MAPRRRALIACSFVAMCVFFASGRTVAYDSRSQLTEAAHFCATGHIAARHKLSGDFIPKNFDEQRRRLVRRQRRRRDAARPARRVHERAVRRQQPAPHDVADDTRQVRLVADLRARRRGRRRVPVPDPGPNARHAKSLVVDGRVRVHDRVPGLRQGRLERAARVRGDRRADVRGQPPVPRAHAAAPRGPRTAAGAAARRERRTATVRPTRPQPAIPAGSCTAPQQRSGSPACSATRSGRS